MLSRFTTRDAFIVLQMFTRDLASWFVPDQDVLDEDERLICLHKKLMMELEKDEQDDYSENFLLKSLVENKISIKINSKINVQFKEIIPIENENIVDELENLDISFKIPMITIIPEIVADKKKAFTKKEVNIINESLNYDGENEDDYVIIQRYHNFYITKLFDNAFPVQIWNTSSKI